MPREIQLTESERKSILALYKKNMSHREIARKINRSKTVVTNFLKDPLKYGSRKRTGRRKKVDERTKRLIIRTASNKTISCSHIVNDLCLKMSRWTINRVIKRSNILKKMKKKHSPALTTAHKDLRLSWAKDHMTWNNEWHKVVWSDEKKFNLDGPDGFSYYWHDLRKEEEIFSTRPQGGGSVMIWASFGWGGKSSICFVDGRMNAKGYREVLKKHLIDIGSCMGGSDWIFQQDNAPIHRVKNQCFTLTIVITRFKSNRKSPGNTARNIYVDGKQFRTKEQ